MTESPYGAARTAGRHPPAKAGWSRRPTRVWSLAVAACLAGVVGTLPLAGCSSNPVTGRSQLMMVSPSQGADMGDEAYREILSQSVVLPPSNPFARTVREITRRLVTANGLGSGTDWEVNALKDDTPNAFALPGGKVGVNTGLTAVARSEAQLATVISHEIAHVVSHHGEERISQQMVVGTGVRLAGGLTGSRQTTGLLAQAATLGIILPYSRTQEAEADEIGLMMMARAGYDPREALVFWKNMEALGGSAPPQFLSTHPSDRTRIQNLDRLMPQALALYQQAGGAVQATPATGRSSVRSDRPTRRLQSDGRRPRQSR